MKPFAETAIARLSADRRRLRLMHGPIDVILTLEGPEEARLTAFARAREAFMPVLGDLVTELPRLRAADGPLPIGQVAQRMAAAVAPFAPIFVTPMAAVAGSVADHLLAATLAPDHGLMRAHANNGGDIALWQASGSVTIAICDNPDAGIVGGRITLPAEAGVGGIATSGWRGRSFSLGIADAVTILAETAAAADAAATLVANAIDLPGHPAIQRARACDLAPDSDLGRRLVTTGVGPLTLAERDAALACGRAVAEDFMARGLIRAAYLALDCSRVAVEMETAIA